jgi:integrase
MGEAIAANKKLRTPWPTLSAQTVNAKWLSRLHSFFGWMAANEILPDNPFAGVRVDAKRKETGPKRTEFAPGDLAKLFSGSHFPNGKVESEDAWAMLVALFTGLRPSEAAQLRLDSIRHERGIMCVVVEERTKTSTSRRFVPLHSTLIRLGIERRIANLRKAGETHLFPRWYADGMTARDKAMANASGLDGIAVTSLNEFFPRFIPKRFNVTYRKGCGISDPAKVFYSFRHTFKTGLARAGVDKAIRDDLCGHDDDSAGAVYVHDVSIEALNEAIQKLKFDGFPL